MDDRENAEPAEPSSPLQPRKPSPDWLLSVFLSLAEGPHGISPTVTFQIHGLLVSGTLISTQKFGEIFTGQIKAASTNMPEVTTAIGDTLAKGFKDLGNAAVARETHIHLSNVTILGAGDANTAPIWRGRVSSIDAFFLGSSPR